MKRGPSYRTIIPAKDILKYPNACLISEVRSGSAVLLPAHVPISKLIESLGDPNRIMNSLKRLDIEKIEIKVFQEFASEDLFVQLESIDPAIKIINPEVNKKAESVMKDVFSNLTLNEKYSIPKTEMEELGATLSKEIADASQIALSLVLSDQETYSQTHALNVSLLCGFIAKRMAGEGKIAPDIVDKAILAGLLFDIGKSVLPKEIINKKEPLSDEEMKIVQKHPLESVRLCKESGITDPAILEGIKSHHERFDGTGYTEGLSGEKIPFIARLLAVADTFDAMTSVRVHRDLVSSKVSFNVIVSGNETLFDPDICKVFLSGMGIYPPGTMVELSNGLLGTVVAVTEGNLLQPKVAVNEENGASNILDLVKAKLFIRRSLDAPPAFNLLKE